jgi:hypothetical protein
MSKEVRSARQRRNEVIGCRARVQVATRDKSNKIPPVDFEPACRRDSATNIHAVMFGAVWCCELGVRELGARRSLRKTIELESHLGPGSTGCFARTVRATGSCRMPAVLVEVERCESPMDDVICDNDAMLRFYLQETPTAVRPPVLKDFMPEVPQRVTGRMGTRHQLSTETFPPAAQGTKPRRQPAQRSARHHDRGPLAERHVGISSTPWISRPFSRPSAYPLGSCYRRSLALRAMLSHGNVDGSNCRGAEASGYRFSGVRDIRRSGTRVLAVHASARPAVLRRPPRSDPSERRPSTRHSSTGWLIRMRPGDTSR